MITIKTYGRKTIKIGYTEKDLMSMDEETLIKTLEEILTNVVPTHDQNRIETEYLRNYFKGEQDIYSDKIKLTRTEINNKTVENWAYALIDFEKTYLLGKPIQYVQLNDTASEEITLLNKYVGYENKRAKDLMLFEDMLICGRGFRYTKNDIVVENDEAPFELLNCDVENTEVVYSSKLGNEQLFSFIETPMVKKSENEEEGMIPYYEYQVYLRNKAITFTGEFGGIKVLRNKDNIAMTTPISLKEHIITEYYLNRDRISFIEIGKDLLNDINYLESLDKDDMEQFVNAIMVFTNAEISSEEFTALKSLGAVCITSTDQKKASVDLLEQRLKASDTQVYYMRLVTALHQILGIPMSSDTGSMTSGDTGKAKLTGQGFTSAGIRAEGNEAMFAMCDRNSLKVILKICKESADSKITKLRVSDIDCKFQRDMSDNLLVKAEALSQLLMSKIPKKFAIPAVNLFGDSNAVVTEMEKEEKELAKKEEETKTNQDNQNGNTVKTTNAIIEKDNQGN